jgi:biopolymer transport protein ExbD
MKRRYQTPPIVADINITPFTDVILVLLIIFMIATPLLSQNSIEVKLPEASSRDVLDNPKQVQIVITAEGVVYLDNKVTSSKELKDQLTGLLKKDPDLKAVVAADQGCRFQEVVKVMDILRVLGVKGLNLSTKSNQYL